ncbi:MAG: 16S rRNA (guanine(966)-N(2))-methyltransferase RsmD [Gammaproteobacteria bacterium]
MKHNASRTWSEIRIIGGKWRGRYIKFPNLPSIRPTPNRVRETLFNWLQPFIYHAHCLDLFAGSGALSFEALSRGAASAVMLDCQKQAINQIIATIKQLPADNAQVYLAELPHHLPAFAHKFDIVFLDPPFGQGLVAPCCELLQQKHLLNPHALVYIETETVLHPLPVPTTWELLRSKTAGEVSYHLLRAT